MWSPSRLVGPKVLDQVLDQVLDGSPVTSSSAVLVACPAPLVALTEYLPLCAAVTAGSLRTARPSLNETCTPGKAAAERTWPSRNQLTSGTGEPAQEIGTVSVVQPDLATTRQYEEETVIKV